VLAAGEFPQPMLQFAPTCSSSNQAALVSYASVIDRLCGDCRQSCFEARHSWAAAATRLDAALMTAAAAALLTALQRRQSTDHRPAPRQTSRLQLARLPPLRWRAGQAAACLLSDTVAMVRSATARCAVFGPPPNTLLILPLLQGWACDSTMTLCVCTPMFSIKPRFVHLAGAASASDSRQQARSSLDVSGSTDRALLRSDSIATIQSGLASAETTIRRQVWIPLGSECALWMHAKRF